MLVWAREGKGKRPWGKGVNRVMTVRAKERKCSAVGFHEANNLWNDVHLYFCLLGQLSSCAPCLGPAFHNRGARKCEP